MNENKYFNPLDNLTPFSKDNQPTPEQKSLGWAKKRTLKELLSLCLSGEDEDSTQTRELLAKILKIDSNELKAMTFEEVMDLKQIQRAIGSGRDWKALKEVAYGTKLDVTTQGEKIGQVITTMVDGKIIDLDIK